MRIHAVFAYLCVSDAAQAIEFYARAFYGERGGSIRDPFGHRWRSGHSIEQVAPEGMQRRYDELMKGG